MGFIDTDEFLVPRTGENLPDFLRRYENFGGLGVFWACFGSNGHLDPQPSVIRAYPAATNNWAIQQSYQVDCPDSIRLAGCDLRSAPLLLPTGKMLRGRGFSRDWRGNTIAEEKMFPTDPTEPLHHQERSRMPIEDPAGRRRWRQERDRHNSFQDMDRHCNAIEDTEILRATDLRKNRYGEPDRVFVR